MRRILPFMNYIIIMDIDTKKIVKLKCISMHSTNDVTEFISLKSAPTT